jgi:hypothetical protein
MQINNPILQNCSEIPSKSTCKVLAITPQRACIAIRLTFCTKYLHKKVLMLLDIIDKCIIHSYSSTHTGFIRQCFSRKFTARSIHLINTTTTTTTKPLIPNKLG